MNVYYSYNQKKMYFVLRDCWGGGVVRDCSSPFVDSETEAQSGKDDNSFTHPFIRSLAHSFIHPQMLLETSLEPGSVLSPMAKELKVAHLCPRGDHSLGE